jgi:hypothetical protein
MNTATTKSNSSSSECYEFPPSYDQIDNLDIIAPPTYHEITDNNIIAPPIYHEITDNNSINNDNILTPSIEGQVTTLPIRPKYFKLTNYNCCHNGLQFNEGYNRMIYKDSLYLSYYQHKQGIYFTTAEHVHKWTSYNGNNMYWIWDVTIPVNAANIDFYEDIIRSDSVILTNRRSLKQYFTNLTKHEQLRILKTDAEIIQFIENPSEELQLQAIRNGTYKHGLHELCTIVDAHLDVHKYVGYDSTNVIHCIHSPTAYVIEEDNRIKYERKQDELNRLQAQKQNAQKYTSSCSCIIC